MIDPITLSALGAALDAASIRQRVGALNIANAQTPGYRPQRVVFESALAAGRARLAHGARLSADDIPQVRIEQASPNVEHPYGSSTVAIDQEVAAISINALHYQALARALSGQYALVDMALTDGRH
jgi:flagellar basal-body rod protein FlgB